MSTALPIVFVSYLTVISRLLHTTQTSPIPSRACILLCSLDSPMKFTKFSRILISLRFSHHRNLSSCHLTGSLLEDVKESRLLVMRPWLFSTVGTVSPSLPVPENRALDKSNLWWRRRILGSLSSSLAPLPPCLARRLLLLRFHLSQDSPTSLSLCVLAPRYKASTCCSLGFYES